MRPRRARTVHGDGHLGGEEQEEEQAERVEQHGTGLLHVVDLRLRRRRHAHEQQALGAVEEDAERVVAAPLGAEQRGEQHAPALRHDQQATREAAPRRAHEDEERVIEQLHTHHQHALEDAAHAPVGGDAAIDDGVDGVGELRVREGRQPYEVHAQKHGEKGVQRGALRVVADEEHRPPCEEGEGEEGGEQIDGKGGFIATPERNLELRLLLNLNAIDTEERRREHSYALSWN